MKQVTLKGLTMKETKKGFVVSSDYGEHKETLERFEDATLWIDNMANNSEHSRQMCEKICEKWHRNIYGGLYDTYYSEEESIKIIKDEYEISLEWAKRILSENLKIEYNEEKEMYDIFNEKGNLIKELEC